MEPSLKQKYAWRKAGIQAFLAFSGCLLSHLVTSAEGMYPDSIMFWKHVLFVAGVTTLVEEMTYLRQWAQQYMNNGNGNGGNGAMKATTAILLAVVTAGMFLAGCPSLQKDAYLTATGAKEFLDSVKSNHPECANSQTDLCIYLSKATAAKDTLIDAAEVYCGSQQFDSGGPCNPPSKNTPAYVIAQDKLKAAMAQYKQAQADLKSLIAKKGA